MIYQAIVESLSKTLKPLEYSLSDETKDIICSKLSQKQDLPSLAVSYEFIPSCSSDPSSAEKASSENVTVPVKRQVIITASKDRANSIKVKIMKLNPAEYMVYLQSSHYPKILSAKVQLHNDPLLFQDNKRLSRYLYSLFFSSFYLYINPPKNIFPALTYIPDSLMQHTSLFLQVLSLSSTTDDILSEHFFHHITDR